MKRILALLLILAAVFLLPSCGQFSEDWDVYQYDGYLNAQWGMTPDEVVYALGINRSQIERMPEEELKGLPEGTFGYELTKYVSKNGTRVRAYLYFAESLYGHPQYVGLYAVKLVYEEGIYNSVNDLYGQEMDGKEIIAELWKRGLYNTLYQENTLPDGSSLYCQYCENTPSSISAGGKKEKLLELVSGGMMPFEMILEGEAEDQPLSTLRFSYGSEEECSSVLYEGYLAAMLKNIENIPE